MTDTLSRVEKGASSAAAFFTIGAMLVGAVLWLGKIEYSVAALQSDHTAVVSRVDGDRAILAARIDRIEESRTLGLQRLAKTEEAVTRINETLARMDAKLDRALGRR